MLLTGPGGTGKTHARVLALKYLMKAYTAVEHKIRFLAPLTGLAASLIDGLTMHSSLKIKVQSKDMGKGNGIPGEDSEDYSVLMQILKHEKVRSEWRHLCQLATNRS
jgi:hypothetical protein